MPDSEAKVPAEDGLKVTITIAEKSGGTTAPTTGSVVEAIESNTFTIDNGKKILTITIAE
jgi:hypothetical protein